MIDPMPKQDIKTPPTLSEARLLTRIEELETKLAEVIAAWEEWSNCDAEVLIDAAIARMNNAVSELTGGRNE